MWTFYCTSYKLIFGFLFFLLFSVSVAFGGSDQYTINQNQTGVTLPGVVMPNGFDEVRAADGTTCRASMAGSGAYLDSGVIGDNSSRRISAYGRLVVPLGQKPTRLDCNKLYQLELKRLELEVELMRRGVDPRMRSGVSNNWASDSAWTNKGRR
ncbi:MAG: hypothetical protein VYB05_10145 [Pseudomonadota bacterium]|nr:hypothetical protein [Pseudomonadota bacterium]